MQMFQSFLERFVIFSNKVPDGDKAIQRFAWHEIFIILRNKNILQRF